MWGLSTLLHTSSSPEELVGPSFLFFFFNNLIIITLACFLAICLCLPWRMQIKKAINCKDAISRVGLLPAFNQLYSPLWCHPGELQVGWGQRLQWRIRGKPQGDKQLGAGQSWIHQQCSGFLIDSKIEGWKSGVWEQLLATFIFCLLTIHIWLNRRAEQHLFWIEIHLLCGDAKACKHCCPWKVFSIVLNQINAALHFYSIKTGTY